MIKIDVWEAAFDRLQEARSHLKDMLGRPGEPAAQKDHSDALKAYNDATMDCRDA
jgi:hypothetical protein